MASVAERPAPVSLRRPSRSRINQIRSVARPTPEWAQRVTDADRRALTPLFWSHANLYGRIDIDMDTHLDLGAAA